MKKNDIVQLTDKQPCAGLAWRGRRDKFVIKIAIINVNKGLAWRPSQNPAFSGTFSHRNSPICRPTVDGVG